MKKDIIKKVVSLGVLLVLGIGGLTGCSTNSENSSSQQTSAKESRNTTVRVAFFPNITHSQALVGKAEGQFQKALGDTNKIDWKQFNAGPAEIEALFAGEIDIGYIGPGPAINGYTKSKGDLQIVAGATDAGAILISRKDLVIKDLKELNGKKIAVPQFGNTQDLSLRSLLLKNGIKDTTKGGTVEIRQAENPDIKTLLDKGEIDAALVPEPWGSRLIKESKANVVLDYNQVFRDGKYTTSVIITSKKFNNDHPDLVEKFVRAHVELTDYINKNPDKAKETVNAQIKELTKKPLANDVLDAAFKRLTVTYDPEKDSVVEFGNLSYDTGFIKEKPDLKNLFSLDALNKVLKEKGLSEIK
ncbi:MAG TPA: aliphatic sulfonate ABC transporter substrate-binding protein [Clostridia bacterium]